MSNKKQTLKSKKPWPTKAAMEQIYEMNLWGGPNGYFYSGDGSHNSRIIEPYISVISSFLKSFNPQLNVCDLGCGDFNVGKDLVKYSNNYVAVDIVYNLINYNRKKFKNKNLEFLCLDIAEDNLPSADCVLIRQVYQHLSNAEIHKNIKKLTNYKYVILTEHLPNGSFIPNKDIISGQGIRLKKQSGIDIIAPPFNFKVIEEKELLSINLGGSKGRIKTTFYKVF